MATEVTFERATLEHCAALAPLMRAEDVAEVQACGYRDAHDALVSGLAVSDVVYAALVHGEVAAIFGVVVPEGSDSGVVWFLTGRAFARHPKAFVRCGRRVMSLLLERCANLSNFIDVRYSAAVRWAKWLGFTVAAPAPYGPNGLLFCHAQIRRT